MGDAQRTNTAHSAVPNTQGQWHTAQDQSVQHMDRFSKNT